MLITPYVLIAQLLVFTSPGRLHEKAYFPESSPGGVSQFITFIP